MDNTENDIYDSYSEQDTRFDELIALYPYLKEARDYGVDIQMLMDNANRSVTERLKRHHIALKSLNKIRNAKRL